MKRTINKFPSDEELPEAKAKMSKGSSDVEEVQKDEEEEVDKKGSEKDCVISKEEAKYRAKRLKEIDLTKEKILCTSCKKNLMSSSTSNVERHPILNVLLCKSCSDFYNDGEFSLDEDGTDKYCRWCGQGGTLFLCADCNLGFCRSCIKRNLNRSTLAAVEQEDWKCFKCNPEPLWELRALCDAVIRHLKERRERKQKSKGELKSFPKPNQRSPSTSSASSKTEKGKKSKRKVIESEDENEQRSKRSKRKSGSESEVSTSKGRISQKSVKKDHKKEYSKKRDAETILDEKSAEELCVQLKDNVSEVKKVLSTVSEFFAKIHDDISVKNMTKYKSRSAVIEEIKKLESLSIETIKKAVGNVEMQYKGYIKNYEPVKDTSESEPNIAGTAGDSKSGDKEKPTEDEGGSDSGMCSKQLKKDKQSPEGDLEGKTKVDSSEGPDSDRPAAKEVVDLMEVDEDSQEIRDVSLFCEPVINSEPEEDVEVAAKDTTSEKEISNVDMVDKKDIKEKESEGNDKKTHTKESQNKETVKTVDVDNDNKSETNKKEGKSSESKEDAGVEKNGCDGNGNCGTPPRLSPELDALDERMESSGIIESSKPPASQDETLSDANCAENSESKGEDQKTSEENSQTDGGGERSNTKDAPDEEEKRHSGDEETPENNDTEIFENGNINDSEEEKKKSDHSTNTNKEGEKNDDELTPDVISETDSENNFAAVKKKTKEIPPRRDSYEEKEKSSGESSGKQSDSLLSSSCGLNKGRKMKKLEDSHSDKLHNISEEVSGKVKGNSSEDGTECADEISDNHEKKNSEDVEEKFPLVKVDKPDKESAKNSKEKDLTIKTEESSPVKKGMLENDCHTSEDALSESEAKENEKAKTVLLASGNNDQKNSEDVKEELPPVKEDKTVKESAKNSKEKDLTIKTEESSSVKKGMLENDCHISEDALTENEAKKNEKAKAALLASSSEDDTGVHEEIEDSPDINSSSDEQRKKSRSKSAMSDSDTAGSSGLQSSKPKNPASGDSDVQDMEDNKLRMKCAVNVNKLSKGTVDKYQPQPSSAENSDADEARTRKEVDKLANLQTLKVKRQRKKAVQVSDSDSDSGDTAAVQRKKQLKKRKKKDKETLMDFQNKTSEDDSSSSENPSTLLNDMETTFGKLMSNLAEKRNKMAETNLLGSSDSDTDEDENERETKKKKVRERKKDESIKEEKTKSEEGEASDEDPEAAKKKKWRSNKLLRVKLSETDTSEEDRKCKAKIEKEKAKERKKSSPRIFNSDSSVIDVSSSSSSNGSDSDVVFKPVKRKRKRGSTSSNSDRNNSSGSDKSIKAKPKRSRIRKPVSDSSSDSDVKIENVKKGKKGDPDTPSKSRKNIKKVMKDTNVEESTRRAAKEEEERRKRIAEKQKMYNEMYNLTQEKFDALEKLVLDFDPETKEELVVVDEGLVAKLKPHQAKGVKFMWDACFESLEHMKKSKGTGCILAHCMGLGKTFQVVTLVHTLLHLEEAKIRTVLVLAPMSTVLNWVNEFERWCELATKNDIEVFELSRYKQNSERSFILRNWQDCGGVMVLGYEMFRTLTYGRGKGKKKPAKIVQTFQSTLVEPGADLIICDEGHLLKNESSSLSQAVTQVRTMRRVVLTGTPLQNNLLEYHCMVQFVKPNLLGTRKEFANRFVNPISNGQYEDSTQYDVKVMKKRAHVLHKMLEGCVQRYDYSVLTPFLPPKFEYTLFVKLTDLQITMYKHYLDKLRAEFADGKTRTTSLFKDFRQLQKVWTHPLVLEIDSEKQEIKRMFRDDDSEGSLRDFVVDSESTTSPSSSSESGSDKSEVQEVKTSKRVTRQNGGEELVDVSSGDEELKPTEWWHQYLTKGTELEDIRESSKLSLLFSLLKECEKIGDKVLVFSPSLLSLDVIEKFLKKIDEANQRGEADEKLGGYLASWSLGLDYFRLDGSSSCDNRSAWCKAFNQEENYSARLFLISTKAGGLGINLYGANRVVIFDASWNPSHDLQSIFRIYRFGQKKPCYVYRFVAQHTMEEKVYTRQVTKLSLACRVVDEQQIERHYSLEALKEMYNFDPEEKDEHYTPMVPKDVLLAELIKDENGWINKYHEHDSLLENKEEEELDEDERKAAWEEYEKEKQGLVNYNRNQNYSSVNQMDPRVLYQVITTRFPMLTPQEAAHQVNVILQQLATYVQGTSQGTLSTYQQLQYQQQLLQIYPQLHQQLMPQMNQLMTQQNQYAQVAQGVQAQNQYAQGVHAQGVQHSMASTSAMNESANQRIKVKSFGHMQNSNFASPQKTDTSVLHNILKGKMNEVLSKGGVPANKANPVVVSLED